MSRQVVKAHSGPPTAPRQRSGRSIPTPWSDDVPMPKSLKELLDIVDDPQSVPDLRSYFGVGLPPDELPAYTGGRFEALAGGGDRDDTRDRITADDLVAVELLAVQVPRAIALKLLEGPLGEDVHAALAEIPVDADLGTPWAASLLADGGPADLAWRLLKAPGVGYVTAGGRRRRRPGVGWVTAGKLLARKRPRLVPVYDTVVRSAIGQPEKVWQWFDDRFAEHDQALPRRLEEARKAAGVSPAVHPPRVLDVILWMRYRRLEDGGSA